MKNKSIELKDLSREGYISNCCGAKVYEGDLCGQCGEHCDPVLEEDEEDLYEMVGEEEKRNKDKQKYGEEN
jgi:bacterioferritin-associated ferredoxin